MSRLADLRAAALARRVEPSTDAADLVASYQARPRGGTEAEAPASVEGEGPPAATAPAVVALRPRVERPTIDAAAWTARTVRRRRLEPACTLGSAGDDWVDLDGDPIHVSDLARRSLYAAVVALSLTATGPELRALAWVAYRALQRAAGALGDLREPARRLLSAAADWMAGSALPDAVWSAGQAAPASRSLRRETIAALARVPHDVARVESGHESLGHVGQAVGDALCYDRARVIEELDALGLGAVVRAKTPIREGRCEHCAAPIVWLHLRTGARVACDPPELRILPRVDGNARRLAEPSWVPGPGRWVVTVDGDTIVGTEEQDGPVVGRASHLAICPHARRTP